MQKLSIAQEPAQSTALAKGQWVPNTFDLKNVGVHLSMLPDGNILYWGRRPAAILKDPVKNKDPLTMHLGVTETYILNTKTLESKLVESKPKDTSNKEINIFCSGHCFLPDGTLLVVGGHNGNDGVGLEQACTYNWKNETWTPMQGLKGTLGRWYPSLIPRPDGSVLVVSGATDNYNPNLAALILNGKEWFTLPPPEAGVFTLYPRLYLAPNNQVFSAGPLRISRTLDLNHAVNNGLGQWSEGTKSPAREAQFEYAASAMYRPGKVIYVSGGGGFASQDDTPPPTQTTQLIDLNDSTKGPIKWDWAREIITPRRHHFATVLPDGTVLVTGGSKVAGFNTIGYPNEALEAELWTPGRDDKGPGTWTTMAPEAFGRGYHHSALLLRDGTVLSTGGGEWDPNMSDYSHVSAQIFRPPYMFRGSQPTLANVPKDLEVNYGDKITITVGATDKIGKVSWTRLPSVTHCINFNQSFSFLTASQTGTKLEITIPTNSTYAPPGHYMLFVMSKETTKDGDFDGIPAVEAPIIRLNLDPKTPFVKPGIPEKSSKLAMRMGVTLSMRHEQVVNEQDKPPVIVGLTPLCPYGLGPCWGGAYEALRSIKDIAVVGPKPSQEDSIAFVYLKDDILPDINAWRKQLREVDGGTYEMRGLGLTLSGVVNGQKDGGAEQLTLAGTSTRPVVVLAKFRAESKLEWDNGARKAKSVTDEEAGAYERLAKAVAEHPGGLTLDVTGTLQKHADGKYSLDVKSFVAPSLSA